MVRMEVLSIYKLNIYQVLNFVFKIKRNTAPIYFPTYILQHTLDFFRIVLFICYYPWQIYR